MLPFFDRNTDSGNAKSACIPEVSAEREEINRHPRGGSSSWTVAGYRMFNHPGTIAEAQPSEG